MAVWADCDESATGSAGKPVEVGERVQRQGAQLVRIEVKQHSARHQLARCTQALGVARTDGTPPHST